MDLHSRRRRHRCFHLAVKDRSHHPAREKKRRKRMRVASVVKESIAEGVTMLRMNRPSTLNAWTDGMMKQLAVDFEQAANDDSIKVLVLTGTDPPTTALVSISRA